MTNANAYLFACFTFSRYAHDRRYTTSKAALAASKLLQFFRSLAQIANSLTFSLTVLAVLGTQSPGRPFLC